MTQEEKNRLRLEETFIKSEHLIMHQTLSVISLMLFPELNQSAKKDILSSPDLLPKIIDRILLLSKTFEFFEDTRIITPTKIDYSKPSSNFKFLHNAFPYHRKTTHLETLIEKSVQSYSGSKYPDISDELKIDCFLDHIQDYDQVQKTKNLIGLLKSLDSTLE